MDLSREEWRDIPGFEGLYQISIDTKEGRCRSLNYNRSGKVKELSNKPSKKSGRIFWRIKKTTWQAARWIALTFPELVENEYFEGAIIDHKDRNVLNNHPSNLKWVTYSGNLENPLTKKHRKETIKGVFKNHPKLSKSVLQMSLNGEAIATYPSAMEAHRSTGVNQGHISDCCRGERKTAGTNGVSFLWRYIS